MNALPQDDDEKTARLKAQRAALIQQRKNGSLQALVRKHKLKEVGLGELLHLLLNTWACYWCLSLVRLWADKAAHLSWLTLRIPCIPSLHRLYSAFYPSACRRLNLCG